MSYVSTNVEIDFDDFMRDADYYEVERFVKDYIKNSDEGWVAETAREALTGEADVQFIVEDPVKRLDVIVALRKMGYTVEGGGPA
jgi:hypothetical protein